MFAKKEKKVYAKAFFTKGNLFIYFDMIWAARKTPELGNIEVLIPRFGRRALNLLENTKAHYVF